MKADLYTAHARTTGGGGLAHRTDAGFVVLTSADGDEIIALIEGKQNEPDLIDHVVAMAQTSGPDAFAMLFTAGGELYVIASGTAQIALTSPSVHSSMRPIDGQVLVHALGAEVNETAANIRLQLDAAPRDARPDVDLLAGTVEADWVEVGIGGAVLAATRADAEVEGTADGTASGTASAQPADPTPATATPKAQPANPTPAPASDITPPDPTPATATPKAQPAPAQVGPVMVLGVACSQAHHNHPDAVYCSQCGTKMGVHHTVVLINGPRPPLGVLVVDDGTTYSLNEDLVIGREPTSDPDVIAGTASPLILTDDTLSLSRKHARIVLDDWLVGVQDLNSSNGTYLSRSGQSESWTKIAPGTTMALEPGDRIRVGGRIIQVELHHVR